MVRFATVRKLAYPMVIVRLATAEREELREVLVESWRRRAPKGLVAAYDAGR